MVITSSMYLYGKFNWEHKGKTEVPRGVQNCFLSAQNKDCINSTSLGYRNMSARRGTLFTHKNADHLLENVSCEDNENVID